MFTDSKNLHPALFDNLASGSSGKILKSLDKNLLEGLTRPTQLDDVKAGLVPSVATDNLRAGVSRSYPVLKITARRISSETLSSYIKSSSL